MQRVYAMAKQVAPSRATVMITGESGTGKGELARALHMLSSRAKAPFVTLHCAALAESLLESELFGHEKGAFTGADRRRAGLFEAAHGGTVFLDEIGELPGPLQAKFLRVLERREITRVGSTLPTEVDVRVIAATHRDLRHEIDAGRFREDLFFRLAQVRVNIAPLRSRPEDIPVLCANFLQRMSSSGERPATIDAAAMEHLASQPWPGNVRELRNVVTRAAALAADGVVRRADVSGEGFGFRGTPEERAALDLSGTFAVAKERAIERFEAAYLTALMRRSGGNISVGAREADLARHHLRDLLKKRGLYGSSWVDTKPPT